MPAAVTTLILFQFDSRLCHRIECTKISLIFPSPTKILEQCLYLSHDPFCPFFPNNYSLVVMQLEGMDKPTINTGADGDQNHLEHIRCTLLRETHCRQVMVLQCYVNIGINTNNIILMTHRPQYRPQYTAGWKNTILRMNQHTRVT